MRHISDYPMVKRAWNEVKPFCGGDPDAALLLDHWYTRPHRAYHTWDHIEDILLKMHVLHPLVTQPLPLYMAALWHDCSYSTQRVNGTLYPDSENVRDSADKLLSMVTVYSQYRDAAYEMISATAHHRLPTTAYYEIYPGFRKDLELFIDLDLSSLAAPWPVFQENWDKIGHEYQWMSREMFDKGRVEFLKPFLEGPIFKRAELESLWGDTARVNIRSRIQQCEEEWAEGARLPFRAW